MGGRAEGGVGGGLLFQPGGELARPAEALAGEGGQQGAEAVREIITTVDMNDLAEDLRAEIRASSASGQRRPMMTT